MAKYRICISSGCPRNLRPYNTAITKTYQYCPFCQSTNVHIYHKPIPDYTVYTDGSCLNNVTGGAGGWAAVIIKGFEYDKPLEIDEERLIKVVQGGADFTTNNRMEIQGILEVLEKEFPEYSKIEFVSDSQYTINGFSTWIHSWNEKQWSRPDGKEVKNQDMWKKAFDLIKNHKHDAYFRWVKGHSNNPYNCLADRIAGQTAKTFLKEKA